MLINCSTRQYNIFDATLPNFECACYLPGRGCGRSWGNHWPLVGQQLLTQSIPYICRCTAGRH